MEITLRDITHDDIDGVLRLINEFAEFEGLTDTLEITADKLASALFDEGAFLSSIVAEAEGRLIGYSFFYQNFFSFRGHRGYHVDDIYITAACRGHGVGRRILAEIAGRAKKKGFDRIDLLVLKWNESAIDFYQSLGGEMSRNDRHVRFVDTAFDNLADS